MGKIFNTLRVVLITIILLPLTVFATNSQSVVISSIKLGGKVSDELTEYVELYNNTDEAISLEGWKVVYAKPTAKITNCIGTSWKSQDSSANVKEYFLTGEIQSKQFVKLDIAMNDNSGGSVQLVNTSEVQDTVGWGNSVSTGVCNETKLATLPDSGKSIDRYLTNEGLSVDSNDNSLDFILSDHATNIPDQPASDASTPPSDDCVGATGQTQVQNQECSEPLQPSLPVCANLELSEIVPNPAGTDTNHEYIEFYNSSNYSVDLSGCSLKIGGITKKLKGTAESGYTAYYGLTLPNADGATIELITSTNEDVVTYPANLKDDQSWAYINGQWQLTEQPTPGMKNVAYMKAEEENITSTNSSSLEACPEGKYRNPETNRCKTLETTETLKDCSAGQERNPDTNRCKQVGTVSSSNLKACSAGQERNPDTNRCRKTVSLVSALTACKVGQERNPDTNRCRKVAGASTTLGNSDKASSSGLEQDIENKQNVSYGVFVAMAVLVLGYGIYEYRDNISNYFAKLKTKFANN